MVQVQQRVLIAASCLALTASAQAPKFYPDDPILKQPAPRATGELKERKLSDYYDFLVHTFGQRGARQLKNEPIPAQNTNTLGEVPDGAWYTNRHGMRRMTLEELVRGPDTGNRPSVDGPWRVTKGKTEGVTPGLEIDDSRGVHYRLKFDPMDNAEMSTAAEIAGSAFFHALGYNVPENYIVQFDRKQLVVTPKSTIQDKLGKKRSMSERDVEEILLDVAGERGHRYRAVASVEIPGDGVGEFQFFGTRKDDPNDTVPHEHRRELRGYFVFCAWLNHEDSRAINTYDTLVEENGVRFLKHYLVDFGALLGSASTKPNSPRSGNEYLFAAKPALLQLITLGLYVPRWAKAEYPNLPSAGRFEYRTFDPEKFKPEYPNPAFENRLPDDTFWAAKQVMAFTEEEIRAIVKKGRYSDPRAEEWIVRCLVERRDKIGRTYFAKVLPLDRFAVKEGRLSFEDLAVRHGLAEPRDYEIRWFHFDNVKQRMARIAGEGGDTLPRAVTGAGRGEYFAAEIRAGDPRKTVTAYLRRQSGETEVVGIDRTW